MNKKNNILDAWITVEQLSEGSINKRDKSLKPLPTKEVDWKEFFSNLMNQQKEQKNIPDRVFKKSGIALYFGIFEFQEVVEKLRVKYKIEKTYEEISRANKFTFSLYFDNELNFIADKFFYTMSGYIRQYGDLPEDFLKVENEFREDLNRKFDEDFNEAIKSLIQEYEVSPENFRYAYVKNLDSGDVNLHSFFIDDLNKAKMITNKNLKRYFNGFTDPRLNLDSNKESVHFNPAIFEAILQPKYYPLGRFPSNPDYALSLMQQVAVNLALNDENTIRSVNGPPGTGKTTLLKDIFADLVVQQAAEIIQLSDKRIQGSLTYWRNAKLGILPSVISDKNIVVASSNNGAVQNIVKELPRNEEIAADFKEQLETADFFKDLSNSKLTGSGYGKDREINSELLHDENWGVFSLEGGRSENVKNVLLNIEGIEKDLKIEYKEDPNVYQEFSQLYKQVTLEREKVQSYYEMTIDLRKKQTEYERKSIAFKQDEERKRNKVISEENKNLHVVDKLRDENVKLQLSLSNLENELESSANILAQAERDYEVIKLQKPKFLWLRKIFNSDKVAKYLTELNQTNEDLRSYTKQQNQWLTECKEIEKKMRKTELKREAIQEEIRKAKVNFENWMTKQQGEINKLKQSIEELEKAKLQSGITELDFSASYEDLQKSSPWFTKQLRILQSELFITALKVRKQFLYENKKQLQRSRIIWERQSEYIGKENGQRIVTEAWQWINFTIPIISTTFASFGGMFKNLNENSIANLFIDEAGQALPQASVGAILRSKKVMVVGDPSQIKPVLTLDSNVLNLIGRHHKVDEKFISADASTQTLVDEASQYGYQKNEDEWIGIPLWVHRRSQDPMFTISNEISYNGLMVQGKNAEESQGKAQWHDITGKANDKFVKEQAELLKNLIEKRLQKDPSLADEIYVISPFKNVANKLVKVLDEIKFTKREKDGNRKPINIGTVHTFQGKEAKIVYFVLGADNASKGAAAWAVSDPNIMNVAATRAKEEFYVIGDKKLYGSLGSEVANKTISIVDEYNR